MRAQLSQTPTTSLTTCVTKKLLESILSNCQAGCGEGTSLVDLQLGPMFAGLPVAAYARQRGEPLRIRQAQPPRFQRLPFASSEMPHSSLNSCPDPPNGWQRHQLLTVGLPTIGLSIERFRAK